MAQITLNATNAQSQRIQEAVAAYNAGTGESLTVKQWIYTVLRLAVESQLSGQIEAAAQVVRAAIDADMQGGS